MQVVFYWQPLRSRCYGEASHVDSRGAVETATARNPDSPTSDHQRRRVGLGQISGTGRWCYSLGKAPQALR